MENKNADNRDIKNILNELSVDDGEILISKGEDGGKLEFTFGSKETKLVFEDGAERTGGLHFESDVELEVAVSSVEVQATEEAPLPASDAAPVEPLKEEFSLPENFDAKEEDERIVASESTKIWSTYVPRFTEVSETYRMNNDPRPRPEKTEKIIVNEEIKSVSDEAIDPTGEIEQEMPVPDAVVVNLGQKQEEDDQLFSVYKFSETEAEESVEPGERTVDDEREEIERLVYRKTEPRTVNEPIKEIDVKEEPSYELPKEKKSYSLPDPEINGSVHVVDYSSITPAVASDAAPDGADGEGAVPKRKGRASEYTAYMQRDGFKDKFLDSIMSSKIRLVAAVAIALVMLLFENFWMFGVDIEALLRLDSIPGAMAIADFQFVACVFALAFPEISRGVRSLIKGKAVPELSLLLSLVVLAIYALVMFIEAPLVDYPLFGALFAMHGIAAITATCLKRSADFIAFKRVSVAGEKKVLDKKMTRTLERENIALDGAVDEYKSKTVRIFKTTFVSDFFKNTDKNVENYVNVIITLSVALVASLIGGVIAYFVGNGWVDAAIAFAALALFTMPAASLFLHKMPFYHSSLECESEKSAMIGEESIYDYSGVDVMAFNDTDIFGIDDVNLKRIIHYGDIDNMMKAMRQMSAIFANAGGPLSIIFSNSLDRKCPPATSPVIETDGISGKVDGHVVCAGTEEYMLRHGIKLPGDPASARAGIADSTKIMYGAEDGVVYVQFHIRYSFSEEFTMILPSLKTDKVVPLIYTRDPNITGELMKTLTGDDCIRVMKKNGVIIGEDKIYRRISSGVVTSGDKINAINVILLAKKYVRVAKRLSIAELVAVGMGTVLSAALAIAGALGVSSLLFFGWQAIWCAALYITSRSAFAVKNKEDDTNDV